MVKQVKMAVLGLVAVSIAGAGIYLSQNASANYNELDKANASSPAAVTLCITPEAVSIDKEVLTSDVLNQAVLSNDLEKVKEILESGEVDINTADSLGIYPLENALVFDNLEMIDLLMQHDVDLTLETANGKTLQELGRGSDSQAIQQLFN